MPVQCCRMKKLSWVLGGERGVLQPRLQLKKKRTTLITVLARQGRAGPLAPRGGVVQPRLQLKKKRTALTTVLARQGRAGPLAPRSPSRLRRGAPAIPTERREGGPVSSALLLVSFWRLQVSCVQHVMLSDTRSINQSRQHCGQGQRIHASLTCPLLCIDVVSQTPFSLSHTLPGPSLHVH